MKHISGSCALVSYYWLSFVSRRLWISNTQNSSKADYYHYVYHRSTTALKTAMKIHLFKTYYCQQILFFSLLVIQPIAVANRLLENWPSNGGQFYMLIMNIAALFVILIKKVHGAFSDCVKPWCTPFSGKQSFVSSQCDNVTINLWIICMPALHIGITTLAKINISCYEDSFQLQYVYGYSLRLLQLFTTLHADGPDITALVDWA